MPHRYFTTEIADGTAVLRGTDAHHLVGEYDSQTVQLPGHQRFVLTHEGF